MNEEISAADANRYFSSLLRRVRAGHHITVTNHGKPVAKIVPASSDSDQRAAAREELFARLEREPTVDIGQWSRDELYER